MPNEIVIRGAREHNLKNISLRLPRDQMVVITGLSGSGKSSLAFDTIYAEGQRRYVESLSAYARQFLGQMQKPDVDSIEGLSPAISIDQRAISKNPRSTVGTVTEIYDYLRLLYARIGKPHCPSCGKLIAAQSQQQIVDRILEMEAGTRFMVVAPLIRGRKGEYKDLLESVRRDGFTRAKIDGDVRLLEEDIRLDKNIRHDISVVVDRLVLKEDIRHRLADSVETAAALSGGLVNIETDGEITTFSEQFSCPDCGVSLAELAPRIFSFNSPYGACEQCTGLGFQEEIDVDLLIPDKTRTLREANILPWSSGFRHVIRWMSRYYDVSLDVPFNKLSKRDRELILYGPDEETRKKSRGRRRSSRVLTGIIPNLERRYRETESSFMRERISELMAIHPCPVCHGARLKAESLAVTVGDKSIYELSQMPIKKSEKFLARLNLTETEELIGGRVIKEIRERLSFLDNVGVGYLTLDRMAGTLSGGEGQRIRLATQIGSSLVGVLYILDEPSIGLHQRDNRKLIDTLHRLRDLGNTVIVVEHDEETMRESDYIVDMGPGAGERGGQIVAEGPLAKILKSKQSLTAAFLNGKRFIDVPARRTATQNGSIVIRGACEHNLKSIDVEIPLGKFVCVTGVSGSGKSTLINDVLYRSLAGTIYRSKATPGEHDRIDGTEQLDKIINIDQSPIGRTPRSNPATYTGVFDHIRQLFAVTPEARVRGYKPGRFSFNVRGGRCEACRGEGTIKIEMHFLPDIYVPCEVCKGRRYDRETLEVRFKGKNIAEVLDMSAAQASDFFEAIPRIARRMQTMVDVGLGYIRLGQPATTLSGGEAQRVKLASELNKVATGNTLYILDEPTTGLHFADIEKLLDVLQRLVDTGNTVVVIEHNLDVIKCADHIIDLGPEGGDEGGYVIATGTPEELAKNRRSETGKSLRTALA